MIVCGQQFQISVHLFSVYFTTFLLCSCTKLHQVQLCGVERRAGCSGPSAEIMLFKVGFVQCSCAPLCPGTPSSSPWLNLQLLHYISQPGVVILESFRVNSEILWQLLTALCCLCRVMMENAVKRWHSCWPEMPLRSHRSASPVGSQRCRSHGCVENSYWIHESQYWAIHARTQVSPCNGFYHVIKQSIFHQRLTSTFGKTLKVGQNTISWASTTPPLWLATPNRGQTNQNI